jgi:hypothetical protein
VKPNARFWLRFGAAALLAPPLSVVPPIIVGILLTVGRATWTAPGESLLEPLMLWIEISVGVAAAAWVLRRLGKTRLRHHMVLALAIGAIPILNALAAYLRLTSLNASGGPFKVPYPCFELFRYETLNLTGAVTTALTLGVTAAVFKWLAYGLDHNPTSVGWKIAGGIFMLALVADMLAPVAEVTGAFPSWHSLRNLCA